MILGLEGTAAQPSLVVSRLEAGLILLRGEPRVWPLELRPEALVTGRVTTEAGVYVLSCRVREVIRDRGEVLLQRLGEPRLRQRRHFFRVRARLGLSLRPAPDASAGLEGGLPFASVTEDVSGGGARFATDAGVSVGDHVVLELDLPEGPVRTLAQVKRSEPLAGGRAELGVEFVRMRQEDQDAVVRFVFWEQVRRRVARGGRP